MLWTQILLRATYIAASYQTFKALETNRRPDEIQKWAKLWVILGLYTAVQPILDTFFCWVPLYNEARLMAIFYLFYPGLQGAMHVYAKWLQPTLLHHEPHIDRRLAEAKAQAGDWLSSNLARLVEVLKEKAALLLAQVQQQAALKAGPPVGGGQRPAHADKAD